MARRPLSTVKNQKRSWDLSQQSLRYGVGVVWQGLRGLPNRECCIAECRSEDPSCRPSGKSRSPDGLSQGQTQPQSRPTSVPGEIRDNERCHPYVGNDLVIDVVVSRQVDVLPSSVATGGPAGHHRRYCCSAPGHFFGTSAQFWFNLKKIYELRLAEKKAASRSRPCRPLRMNPSCRKPRCGTPRTLTLECAKAPALLCMLDAQRQLLQSYV